MKKIILLLFICLLLPLYSQDTNNVGLVKRLNISLPGELLVAAKVDDKSDAMVRIISYKKSEKGFDYELEFIGLEPGTYNLIKYLRTASKNEEVNLKEYKIEIDTSLDKSFNGELLDFQKTVPTLTPWYKKLNYALIALWVFLLPVIILYGRKRKKVEEVKVVLEKSLSEKICELLASLEGNSTKEVWQRIEGLIFQHWCQKKQLEGMAMHEAISKLKADDEAGPFILKLEEGLHSKKHRDEDKVTALIKDLTTVGGAL